MSRRVRDTLLPPMYRCASHRLTHNASTSLSCPYQSHRRYLSGFSTTSLRTTPLPKATTSRSSIRTVRPRFNNENRTLIKDERIPDDNPNDSRYKLSVGVIIERLPRFLTRPPQWEIEYEKFIETNRFRLNGPVPKEIQPKTTEDNAEFADIITADDTADNRRSMERAQDDSLILLIKRNDRSDNEWTLPLISFHYDFDTQKYPLSMRGAAEETIKRWFTSDCKILVLGNAPVGLHKYDYTQDYIQKNTHKLNNNNNNNNFIIGKKLYLFHSILITGIPQFLRPLLSTDRNTIKPPADDYVWVTKKQIKEYITDPQLIALLTDVIVTGKEYNEITP